jgi:hypothetical protein
MPSRASYQLILNKDIHFQYLSRKLLAPETHDMCNSHGRQSGQRFFQPSSLV